MELARTEVTEKSKSKDESVFEGNLTTEKMEVFSWKLAIEELKKDYPILTSVLIGAVTKKR